jgi:hypothetical protein
MLDSLKGRHLCASAAHGEVENVLQAIQQVRQQFSRTQRRVPPDLQSLHSKDAVLPKLLAELESGKNPENFTVSQPVSQAKN